ncbi:MAG TPA: hypothetical protein VMP08_15790 [Anaerolineae bacterium]|nr:hypothetical protein [Anaerolineae bacterium]
MSTQSTSPDANAVTDAAYGEWAATLDLTVESGVGQIVLEKLRSIP